MENTMYEGLATIRSSLEDTLARILALKRKEGEGNLKLRELVTEASVMFVDLRRVRSYSVLPCVAKQLRFYVPSFRMEDTSNRGLEFLLLFLFSSEMSKEEVEMLFFLEEKAVSRCSHALARTRLWNGDPFCKFLFRESAADCVFIKVEC